MAHALAHDSIEDPHGPERPTPGGAGPQIEPTAGPQPSVCGRVGRWAAPADEIDGRVGADTGLEVGADPQPAGEEVDGSSDRAPFKAREEQRAVRLLGPELLPPTPEP